MTLVADTSIWVEYLRRGAHGWAAELDELLERGEVLMCGPVLAELLAGPAVGSPQRILGSLAGAAVG